MHGARVMTTKCQHARRAIRSEPSCGARRVADARLAAAIGTALPEAAAATAPAPHGLAQRPADFARPTGPNPPSPRAIPLSMKHTPVFAQHGDASMFVGGDLPGFATFRKSDRSPTTESAIDRSTDAYFIAGGQSHNHGQKECISHVFSRSVLVSASAHAALSNRAASRSM